MDSVRFILMLDDQGLAGSDRIPDRRKGMSWSEFLRSEWNLLSSDGFLHDRSLDGAEIGSMVCYHVLFVIRLATRAVKIVEVVLNLMEHE